MFEYITGKVVYCSSGKLVLDVAGVGFQMKVPLSTEISVQTGENAKVYIHTVIRDDNIRLFGFKTLDERAFFEKLQSISGVGPALATTILSGGTPKELKEAILSENLVFFKKIKGVGPKTARRIILELKGTVSSIGTSEVFRAPSSGLHQDAVGALVGLGYPQMQATDTVSKVLSKMGDSVSLDDLIRESLKDM